jgi:hypothetical protein
MTDFTVSITDSAQLYALKAATAAHNSRQPAEATPLTEADYVQYVMGKAAESWAQSYPMPVRATYESALSELAKAKAAATPEQVAKLEAAETALYAVKEFSGSWYADNGDGTVTLYPKSGEPAVTFSPDDDVPEASVYATWLAMGGKPLPPAFKEPHHAP